MGVCTHQPLEVELLNKLLVCPINCSAFFAGTHGLLMLDDGREKTMNEYGLKEDWL